VKISLFVENNEKNDEKDLQNVSLCGIITGVCAFERQLISHLKQGFEEFSKEECPMADDDDSIRRNLMRAASSLSQIGIMIIACIAIGILIGRFLDNWLGTSPWLTVVFVFLGVAAAFKSIFDLAKKG
jgi:ATP synthase protein I